MILVDALTGYGSGLWSHMVSTKDADELHEFAGRLGLKRSWFQERSFAHYDIRPSKHGRALALGARLVDSRILLFANFDYAARRPGYQVPEPYAGEIATLLRGA